jgi:hypothetical protein
VALLRISHRPSRRPSGSCGAPSPCYWLANDTGEKRPQVAQRYDMIDTHMPCCTLRHRWEHGVIGILHDGAPPAS